MWLFLKFCFAFFCICFTVCSWKAISVTNQDLSKYNITHPSLFQVVLLISTQNQRGTCMAHALKICHSAGESSPVWKLSSRFCSQSIWLRRRGKASSPGTQRWGFTDASGVNSFQEIPWVPPPQGCYPACYGMYVLFLQSLYDFTLLYHLFYLRVACTFISLHSLFVFLPQN